MDSIFRVSARSLRATCVATRMRPPASPPARPASTRPRLSTTATKNCCLRGVLERSQLARARALRLWTVWAPSDPWRASCGDNYRASSRHMQLSLVSRRFSGTTRRRRSCARNWLRNRAIGAQIARWRSASSTTVLRRDAAASSNSGASARRTRHQNVVLRVAGRAQNVRAPVAARHGSCDGRVWPAQRAARARWRPPTQRRVA